MSEKAEETDVKGHGYTPCSEERVCIERTGFSHWYVVSAKEQLQTDHGKMYQDHLTKSCVLWPVKSKRPTEAASPILDLCLLLGAPAILQSDNATELTANVHSFHWLPIEQRIEYKLSLLCFKSISLQVPICLSELLHLYTPSRELRSSTDTWVFRIPSFRTKSCGQRSYSYQAPVI